MEAEKSTVLGHLVEITGNSFVAKLTTERDGSPSEKMIGMEKVRIGQVGSYLMVKQSGNELILRLDITFVCSHYLSLTDHMHRFIALNCSPGCWVGIEP